jgi:hypothetical protein
LLLEGLGERADAPFVAALRALAAQAAAPSPATLEIAVEALPALTLAAEADAAFADDDYDRSLELYLRLPPTPRLCRRMLTCAAVDGSARTARLVLDAIAAASIEPASLGDPALQTLARLEALLAAPAPARDVITVAETLAPVEGWLAWARWVAGGNPAEAAAMALRDHAASWTLAGMPPEAVEDLAAVLYNAAQFAPRILEEAIPLLFEEVVIEPERPVRAFRPLYAGLHVLLLLAEQRSPDDLELLRQLAECRVVVGMTVADYMQLATDLEGLLEENRSLATLGWALDVAEVLSLNPAPDPAARLRFQAAVLGMAESLAHRLDTAQARAVRLLCRDAKLDVPTSVSEVAVRAVRPASPFARLAGKHVAIYTLAEQAGRRAAELLRELVPQVQVTVRNDTVCTDQLAALARSADVFIFAWRSSKHQAYYCIRNHRPKALPFLHPLGKGSASIMQVLQDA